MLLGKRALNRHKIAQLDVPVLAVSAVLTARSKDVRGLESWTIFALIAVQDPSVTRADVLDHAGGTDTAEINPHLGLGHRSPLG